MLNTKVNTFFKKAGKAVKTTDNGHLVHLDKYNFVTLLLLINSELHLYDVKAEICNLGGKIDSTFMEKVDIRNLVLSEQGISYKNTNNRDFFKLSNIKARDKNTVEVGYSFIKIKEYLSKKQTFEWQFFM